MADAPNDDAPEDKVNKRLIYGRRQGHRLHKKQARLVDEWLPRLTPDVTAEHVPADWFAQKYDDYVLEIGFGGGEHLAARALANPQTGFIGCEPFLNGVAKLVATVADEGRENIAIYQNDARTILDALPDGAPSERLLNF